MQQLRTSFALNPNCNLRTKEIMVWGRGSVAFSGIKMKSRISAICIVSGFTILTNISAGLAADMAIKAPMAAPPAAYNWTGWYAGINVGGGWGESKNTFTADFPPPTPAGADTTHLDGLIGGGQLGYNWQSGAWVLGLETDIQGAGQRGSNNTACSIAGCIIAGSTIADTEKLTWFGTTRARVGIASGSWLAYVTGGAAYGGVSATGVTTIPGVGSITVAKSSTQGGWTVGGGIEAALTGKWTWKVEYLYMDLGTINASIADPFIAGATVGGSAHFTDNILRAGVNMHF
jgi:outer membrane immunogenic protein